MKSNINLFNDDSLNLYKTWPRPTVIISDGAYGVNGFTGDLNSHKDLGSWYEPHIKQWSKYATPNTTLWFWNTEVGWATVHNLLLENGWNYVCCCIWDKGKSHIAGNVNTQTIRHFPIATEVCVQYVKKAEFKVGKNTLSMQDWLRYEWQRTGLPLSKTNEACGVKNAATRKYFTSCHLWYMPPSDAFEKICNYANTHGKEDGKPYFSLDGIKSITKQEWELMRSKFNCPFGITNVWNEAQLNGVERVKTEGNKPVHLNQKPVNLLKRIIECSSDVDDVVWDPFGGLFSTAVACFELNRGCYTAESNNDYYKIGSKRVSDIMQQG